MSTASYFYFCEKRTIDYVRSTCSCEITDFYVAIVAFRLQFAVAYATPYSDFTPAKSLPFRLCNQRLLRSFRYRFIPNGGKERLHKSRKHFCFRLLFTLYRVIRKNLTQNKLRKIFTSFPFRPCLPLLTYPELLFLPEYQLLQPELLTTLSLQMLRFLTRFL